MKKYYTLVKDRRQKGAGTGNQVVLAIMSAIYLYDGRFSEQLKHLASFICHKCLGRFLL